MAHAPNFDARGLCRISPEAAVTYAFPPSFPRELQPWKILGQFAHASGRPKRAGRRIVKWGVFRISSAVAMPLVGLALLSMPPIDDAPSARAGKPVAKLTDRDLVLRAKEGDAHAFGQLVRRHQQRI